MMALISGIAAIVSVVLQALWTRHQEAKKLENNPDEDLREAEVAATAGDEASVQAAFAGWDRAGRNAVADRVSGIRP
jgi:FtsZ-interacting cell division protein ZipA